MLAHQTLRKARLVARQAIDAEVRTILAALRDVDPEAALLPTPDAIVSRDIADRLWKALPDESEAIVFDTAEALTAAGPHVLDAPPDETVVLHLGWDCLAVRTTLQAAWHAWPRFFDVSTAAHNTVIYPETLQWYVVRAGTNLYPMTCMTGAEPVLRVVPPFSR